MAAMDTLMPGIRTGNFAPCRAGGFGGNHLTHSSFIPAKSASLKQDDSDTRDPFEGSACGFEDGRYILQALSGLLLDRIPNNLPGYRIVRPRA
jgi:hypothetical protein